MNEEIYFSVENIYEIISDILGKNGLYETPYDAARKEKSMIITVLSSAKNLARENMSEKDFIPYLQKQMNISLQIAGNLTRDIKEKILPYAEKVEVSDEVAPVAQAPTKQEEKETEKPIRKAKRPIEVPLEEISNLPKKPITPQMPKSSGPDNYREPIG